MGITARCVTRILILGKTELRKKQNRIAGPAPAAFHSARGDKESTSADIEPTY